MNESRFNYVLDKFDHVNNAILPRATLGFSNAFLFYIKYIRDFLSSGDRFLILIDLN